MNVLIVEDDKNKCDQIAQHLQQFADAANVSIKITRRHSYRSGLRECLDSTPDFLILDMTMATYDHSASESGGRPRHFAGRDILRELRRRRVVIPSIICTGFDVIGAGREERTFDALAAELEQQFPEVFRGAVRYNPSESEWKDVLSGFLAAFLGEHQE